MDETQREKLLSFVFYLLLFTFFLQARFTPFGKYQTVDYLIPWIYLSDLLILALLLATFIFKPIAFTDESSNILQSSRSWVFLFVIFQTLAIISNLNTHHPLSAWYHWFKLWEMGFFALWVGWFIKTNARSPIVEQVFLSLNLGLILQSLIALGEWFKQASLGLQLLGEWHFSVLTPGIAKVLIGNVEYLRPYATFPHPNVLGGIMAIVAAINLALFLTKSSCADLSSLKERTNRRIVYGFCFLFFSLTTFLSFSRSAWFADCILTLVVLIGWFFNKFRLAANPKLFIVRFSLLIPILFSALFMISQTPPGKIISERFAALKTTDRITLLRRDQLNQAALMMLKDKPLLGVGLNQFIPNLENYSAPISGIGRFLQPVHNLWLLIAAETGILGLLAFLSLTVSLLFPLLKPKIGYQPPKIRQPLIIAWLGIFLLSLTDHYFWTLQAGVLFFWLTVGLSSASG